MAYGAGVAGRPRHGKVLPVVGSRQAGEGCGRHVCEGGRQVACILHTSTFQTRLDSYVTEGGRHRQAGR